LASSEPESHRGGFFATSELSIGVLGFVGGSRWLVGPTPNGGECDGEDRKRFGPKTKENGLPEVSFAIDRRLERNGLRWLRGGAVALTRTKEE
jgi:hypothetical protein